MRFAEPEPLLNWEEASAPPLTAAPESGRRSERIREFDVEIDPEWLFSVPRTSATFAERVFSKIDASGDCWEWMGALTKGYGTVGRGGRGTGTIEVHRAVWELLVGPIDDGLQLDHLCRNRACCNPDHLEPVTPEENKRRGFGPAVLHGLRPTCKYGHPKDGITKLKDGTSHRYCKTCARLNTAARYAAKELAPCCKHGHEFTPANTYTDSRGRRRCKECKADKQRGASAVARIETGEAA